MTLKRVVIDTCVIESSLRSKFGASYQLLKNVHTHRFRFGISVSLFLEYEYRIEKLFRAGILKISEKAKNSILKALAFYGDEVPIYYKLRPNLKDENDNMVLECAVNYNSDFLITHNVKDFHKGDLSAYQLKIITPQKFLQEVRNG